VTLESTSGGASRRQGVELEWRLPVTARAAFSGDWTFLDARYTSQTAEPEDGGGPPMVLNGLRVFNTAKYVGDATLEIAATSALQVRIGGNFVGPYSPFDEPGEVRAPYGLLHLGGAWTVRGTELDFGIRNLLDRAYPEIVAGHIVAPGQPRSVVLSARRKI